MSLESHQRVLVVDERWESGEQLIEDDTEGEHIGCGREILAKALLGGHVGGGADDRAESGGGGAIGPVENLGDPEVGDLDRATSAIGRRPREEQVLRLDVAMQDAALVGVMKGICGGDDDCARGLGAQPGRRESIPQRAPGESLHDEQAHLLGFDEVVHRDDMGVVEGCR